MFEDGCIRAKHYLTRKRDRPLFPRLGDPRVETKVTPSQFEGPWKIVIHCPEYLA
jgi:hypothetical protein